MLNILAASIAFSSSTLLQSEPPKIVFVSDRDGNDQIYSMLADGSNVQRLTNDPGKDVNPCWSTDGKHIAWASNRSGNWDIWTMDADGSNQENLTDSKDRQDTNPMWSASDGNIAFISNHRFYVVQPDGTGLIERTGLVLPDDCQPSVSAASLRFCLRDASGHLLIREGYEMNIRPAIGYGTGGVPNQVFHPSWSTDSKEIIFDSGGPNAKIYTVDLQDPAQPSQVAMEGNGFEPVFANQDTAAVYTSSVGIGKGSDIYMIGFDAAERTHGLPKPADLTHNPGNDNEPCYWEPASGM